MRHKMSVSIEEDLILQLNRFRSIHRIFRSKSHVIEEALRSYLEAEGVRKW